MAKTRKVSKKSFSLEATGFYSDMSADGMLYAVLVRSNANSGAFSKIEIPDLPEGYFFFTAKDVPGKNTIDLNGTDVSIFAGGEVSYFGEPLGILCGPDKNRLSELADSVKVSMGEGVADAIDVSTESGAAEGSREIVTREIKTGLYAEKSVDEAESEIVNADSSEFHGVLNLRQVESLWQETSGAFCKMEGVVLHVYSPTNWSYLLLDILKQSIGLKNEQIFIHKTKTTGMYSNGIYKSACITAQVGMASYLTKKPVKLVFTQKEQTLYMKPGVNTVFSYKTSVFPEGRIKSMNISIEIDIGSKNPFVQEIVDRIALASVGIYAPENLYIRAKAVTSANPPTSVYPKIIDSQSFFAIETHIQQIATQMHILPDEFRFLNIKKANPEFSLELKTPDATEPVLNVIRRSDFNRKFFSFKINADNRMKKQSDTFFALPLRGIGFACGYDGSGYYGKSVFSCNQKVEATLQLDDTFEIHTIKPSATVEAFWKKTVNEILQIPPERIKINAEFPMDEIPNLPDESNSSVSIMTFLLKRCCLDIQRKRFHEPLPITSKRQISNAIKNKWNAGKFSGTPFHSSSFGAAVVELELDSYTYMEKIKGIWMCIDCGEIFDVKAAERVLKLSIQQELACLVENERITCDNYNISFVNSKKAPGQIGEIAHNIIPAAFASALSIALSTEISTLPVNQSLLYELIKEREMKTNQNPPPQEQSKAQKQLQPQEPSQMQKQPQSQEQPQMQKQSQPLESKVKEEASNENSGNN